MSTMRQRRGPLEDPFWHGMLCIENHADIAERLRRMLDGKFYTFVSTCEGVRWPTEVRTSNRLASPMRVSCDRLEDGPLMAHITFEDGRYVWGLHTTDVTEREAHVDRRHATQIAFQNRYGCESVEVQHYNGLSEMLHWTVMVEDHEVDS